MKRSNSIKIEKELGVELTDLHDKRLGWRKSLFRR